MNPHKMKELDFAGLLRLAQQEQLIAAAGGDWQGNYRNLLRYALQIAAEREAAAGALSELRELWEEYAPAWYAAEQHERLESVLELLHKL